MPTCTSLGGPIHCRGHLPTVWFHHPAARERDHRRNGVVTTRFSRSTRTTTRIQAVKKDNKDIKALTDLTKAEGPPGIVGFGFDYRELSKLRRHFEPIELVVVDGAAACVKGATVADAAALLTGGSGPFPSSKKLGTGESFKCFSRVVLFCGLDGDEIQGLIEVWPMELCDSELISFSYLASSMLRSDLEATLLKIIKATDANEDEVSEETSKDQLRKMLAEMKDGGGISGRGQRRAMSSGGSKKPGKGFGR